MKEEIHLFIIWENGREKQNEILEDIKLNFEIIKVIDMEWSKESFSTNLSRFYGTNLPKGSSKEQHCGNGKFLLIIVKDTNPKYEERLTSKGPKIVNVNMFDKKDAYRNITGGGHKIHGTNDENETNHDLTLLLDKNIEDFLKENNRKWNEKIEYISKDLFGNNRWNTVNDMFYALNNCTNYAILRNYESLPNEIYEKDHNDIDIICDSLEDVAYVLNAKPVFEEKYRVHYKTNVENRVAYFDLRHIGDNYYFEKIEKNILNERVYNKKGFYTLSKENYFYTLLYHALIQKYDLQNDYKEKLMQMNIELLSVDTTLEEYCEILKKWMIKNEYLMVVPEDKSVIFNKVMAEYFKPFVYKEENDSNLEKIDILMATYNGEKFLDAQIKSILDQTYSNFNLIISDDCSKDGTRKILEKYAEKDKRITLYFQEKNIGYVKNFEFLLGKVTSNIYALSDQDDIWLPEKIEKSIENMKKNDSDLVFGDLILIDENENNISDSFWEYKKIKNKIRKDKKYNGLLLNNYVTGCTLVSKKEYLKHILPLPKNSKYIIHDYWIAIIVALKGKISYLDKPYIKYRQHREKSNW